MIIKNIYKYILNIIKVISAVAILLLFYFYACDILVCKIGTFSYPAMNLYSQKSNSIDVLCVGSSQIYSTINPAVLWDKYGITSYDLSTANQSFYCSYYLLKEALKTQKPKLVVLDVFNLIMPEDRNKIEETVYYASFGMKNSINRIQMILNCDITLERKISYLLKMPHIHSRYKELNHYDYLYNDINFGKRAYKGYYMTNSTKAMEPKLNTDYHENELIIHGNISNYVTKGNLDDLNNIIELCHENKIPLLLIKTPIFTSKINVVVFDSLQDYVNKLSDGGYKIKFFDYTKPKEVSRIGLDHKSDFADIIHQNYKGSMKTSEVIAYDIKNMFDIPDRRLDEYYNDYYDSSRILGSLYCDYVLLNKERIDDYLKILNNIKMNCFIVFRFYNDKNFKKIDKNTIKCLKDLNINIDGDTNSTTIIIDKGEVILNNTLNDKINSIFRLDKAHNLGVKSQDTDGMLSDIIYSNKILSAKNQALNIFVYDYNNSWEVDNCCFYYDDNGKVYERENIGF